MSKLTNENIVEICLSFMLGISIPTLIDSISFKIMDFWLWFFIVVILLGIIGSTIYVFLTTSSENKGYFVYEVSFIIFLTIWVYSIARIIKLGNEVNKYGQILTIILFLGYGLWGLLYHKYEKKKGLFDSMKTSKRFLCSCLSIIFMILIYVIHKSHLFI